MKGIPAVLCALLWTVFAAGQDLNCDLGGYKPQDGLKAQLRGGALEFNWQGERRDHQRASFTIRDGQPMVQELAILSMPRVQMKIKLMHLVIYLFAILIPPCH